MVTLPTLCELNYPYFYTGSQISFWLWHGIIKWLFNVLQKAPGGESFGKVPGFAQIQNHIKLQSNTKAQIVDKILQNRNTFGAKTGIAYTQNISLFFIIFKVIVAQHDLIF